ncbi:uncharacterized protein J3R85_002732 [Psidium guajava]|nr:uncharacterized protein J3R85_002732 [Psidium guajava]
MDEGISSDLITIYNDYIDYLEDHSTVNLKIDNYKEDQCNARQSS